MAYGVADYPLEMLLDRRWLVRMASVSMAVAATASAGCGEVNDRATTTSTAGDLAAFCSSIALLDDTDGTTEASVVVAVLDDLRNASPAEIRAAVDLMADTLIVNNYPEAADPSMEAAPFDELDPASARLAAYAEANCESDS